MHFSWQLALLLGESLNIFLSLPTSWFNIASLVVRKLLWARQVRSYFVLRRAWQSFYLLLSDRMLFDLELFHFFQSLVKWPQLTRRVCFSSSVSARFVEIVRKVWVFVGPCGCLGLGVCLMKCSDGCKHTHQWCLCNSCVNLWFRVTF